MSSGFIELHVPGDDRTGVYVAVDRIAFFYSKFSDERFRRVTKIVFDRQFSEEFSESVEDVKAKIAKALGGGGEGEEAGA